LGGWPAGATGLLIPAAWAIAKFLVLNTLGNIASKSRLERTVFAELTRGLGYSQCLCGAHESMGC